MEKRYVAEQDSALGRLCENCEVLIFDDSTGFSSTESEVHGDADAYLKFDSDDQAREFHLHPLGKEVQDFPPNLPNLQISAERGCNFCLLLRDAALAVDLFSGLDPLPTGLPRGQEPILISYTYVWRNGSLYGPSKRGLSRLLVNFFMERRHEKRTLCFSIDTPSAICSRWLRIQRSIEANALSQENVQWMKTSLARCKDKHGHMADTRSVLPSRLLDVSSKRPRLICTADVTAASEELQYAALSYCWGAPNEATQQLKTTDDSIARLEAGIEESSFTKVQQDAIATTRALSLKYLWVDALCIKQDSLLEWELESARMGDIYTNAEVTVCALASSSCLQGFLCRSQKTVRIRFRSHIRFGLEGILRLRFCGIVSDSATRCACQRYQPLPDQENSQWIRRGWTYQEKAMSTRKLWFGTSRIHFLCDSVCHTEGEELRTPGWDTSVQRELLRSSVTKLYKDWDWHVTFLSKREFTRRTDILPSLSGIASAFFRVLKGDTYCAGLWSGNLAAQLLWYIPDKNSCPSTLVDLKKALEDANPYIAPSWSWASRGIIAYGLDDAIGDHISGVMTSTRHHRVECDKIQAQITLKGSNPYGQLTSGKMILQGRVCPIPATFNATATSSSTSEQLELKEITVGNEYLAHYVLDWSSPANSTGSTVSKEDIRMLLLYSSRIKRNTLFRRGTPLCGTTSQSMQDRSTENASQNEDESEKLDERLGLKRPWHESNEDYHGGVMGDIGNRLSKKVRQEPESSSQDGSEEGREECEDDDVNSEDEIADLTSESRSEDSGENYDEDELSDVLESGKRICLCKRCEESWGDDSMRLAYGLLISSTKKPNQDFRVGVFKSFPLNAGGLGYFLHFPQQTVEMI